MRYLFWNVNKIKINNYVVKLSIKNNYDIIALAEYGDDLKKLLNELRINNINMKNISNPEGNRIIILIKEEFFIESLPDTEYYTIKSVNLKNDTNQLVVVVHLPSKMYSEDEERRIELQCLASEIENYEEKYCTKNTVIMGDFNANPFENCMVSASGLHAINSLKVAKGIKRTIKKREYNFFYNPMWNKFGDFRGTEGTYFYRAAKPLEYFWNIFDQVVIRPQIAELFSNDSLNIINEIENIKLVNNNKITVGDHLPIEFIIEEE